MAVKKKAEEAANATGAAETDKEEKTVNNMAGQEKAGNGAVKSQAQMKRDRKQKLRRKKKW